MSGDKALWRCECGAALGLVRRVTAAGRPVPVKVRSLVVFTPATRSEDAAALEVREEGSLVELRGDGWVKCPYCGRRKHWHAAEHALGELLLLRRKGTAALE